MHHRTIRSEALCHAKTHRGIFATGTKWREGSSDGIENAVFAGRTNAAWPIVILILIARVPNCRRTPMMFYIGYLEYINEGEKKVGK